MSRIDVLVHKLPDGDLTRDEKDELARLLARIESMSVVGAAASGSPTTPVIPQPPRNPLYFRVRGETNDANLWGGADLIVYSDSGSTEKARIDGATGKYTLSNMATDGSIIEADGTYIFSIDTSETTFKFSHGIYIEDGNFGYHVAAPDSVFHVNMDDETNRYAQFVTQYATDDNSAQEVLRIQRLYTGGAGANGIGSKFTFYTEDDGGATQQSAEIISTLTDVSAGAEYGDLQFDVVQNASLVEAINIGTGIVVNETGADRDFRIEGSGEANAFFLQGSDGYVGLGNAAPQRVLHITDTSTGSLTFIAMENVGTTDDNTTTLSFRTTTTGAGAAAFTELGAIRTKYVTHDHATRKGDLEFFAANSAAATLRMKISDDIELTPIDGITITLGNDAGDDFAIDSTTFVVEGDTGNVGIGNAAPERVLHITDAASGSLTFIAMENTDTTDNNTTTLSFRTTTTGAGAAAFTELGAIRTKYVTHDHATRKGDLEFFVANSGAATIRLKLSDDIELTPTNSTIIDVTNTEALLVRKASDGGDVFIVDTTNAIAAVGATPDTTYKLWVEGTMGSQFIRMASTAPQMRWYDTNGSDADDYLYQLYNNNNYYLWWRDDSLSAWTELLYAEGDTGKMTIGATTTDGKLLIDQTSA
ncbi:MAG: hypothetical protein ACXABY_19160, partial [Candidatus Thorarchaeota archaeon]